MRRRVSKRRGLRKAMEMRRGRMRWRIRKMKRAVSSESRLRIWRPGRILADLEMTSKLMSVHLKIQMPGSQGVMLANTAGSDDVLNF
jgi:hypothetical protein